jgi:restriction system protein
VRRRGAAAQLREFNLTGTSEPIEEIRSYLAANYDARSKIHPRVFEETVASVFRGLGYDARVTAYSGDDGIDVVLDGPDDQLIGIQVKRQANRVAVKAIRELAGALLIGGYTRGIFVTTSDFQSGAQRTADLSALSGKPIELLNAEKFFDALKLVQRKMYVDNGDSTAPFTRSRLVDLGEQIRTDPSVAP